MQTVTGTVAPATIHSPSVTVSSSADEIEISVTSGSVIAYFAADPTDAPAPGQTIFTITAGTPYSGTAAGLDWSSTNFRLLLQNTNVTDAADFTVVVRD